MVHTIGGLIALAGSIVLGPRLGRKFKRDGGAPMLPHEMMKLPMNCAFSSVRPP